MKSCNVDKPLRKDEMRMIHWRQFPVLRRCVQGDPFDVNGRKVPKLVVNAAEVMCHGEESSVADRTRGSYTWFEGKD